MAISAAKFPYTGPYSVEGNGKHKGNTALALKRAMSRLGHLLWEPDKWDNVFNAKLEAALDRWDAGYDGYAERRWEKLRKATVDGKPALDATCLSLVISEALGEQAWRNLGPVFNGGKSVLKHDLTHKTSSIPLYPAFDDAFSAGTVVIAPENLKITKASSSNPGDACYALGESDLQYWFGHLVLAPEPGRFFAKGSSLGRVVATSVGGGPHVHVGINVENLWGQGKQMAHRDNYTHGAPLIGEQLAAWSDT